jgi:hypothetical protein
MNAFFLSTLLSIFVILGPVLGIFFLPFFLRVMLGLFVVWISGHFFPLPYPSPLFLAGGLVAVLLILASRIGPAFTATS